MTKYRCSECGRPRHAIVFRGDTIGTPIACVVHPKAPVLSWTMPLQTVVTYLRQRVDGGATIDELRRELTGELGNHLASAGDIAAGFTLFERWGGLPELMHERSSAAASPVGLFGPRTKENQP